MAELAVDHLVHGGDGALVLAAQGLALAEELDAVALHGAALGDVGLARGLGERLRGPAAVLLDGARQHVVQQHPHVVEAHRDVRRDVVRGDIRLEGLVALHHLLGQLAHARLQVLGVDELGGRRVHGVEAFHLVAEGLLQLVHLAVARAVADVGAHAKPLLLRLAEEQVDVGIVAGVEEDVRPRGPELRHQRGQVGGLGRVALLEHDLHALLLALGLVGGGHPGAVRAVLVDDRDAHVLGRLLQPVGRVAGDVGDRAHAEEAAVGLGAEGVLEIAILQHRIRDGGGDPEELLLLVDPLGDGHGVGATVDAGQDVDLLDVQEPLGFVDRDVGLGLAVAVDLDDLVLAEDAALFVDVVDHHLGAAPAVQRAGGGEWARVVVEECRS